MSFDEDFIFIEPGALISRSLTEVCKDMAQSFVRMPAFSEFDLFYPMIGVQKASPVITNTMKNKC